MKIEGKIEKLIALIRENDKYCKPKNFTQIDNYCESEVVVMTINPYIFINFLYIFCNNPIWLSI